MVGVESTIIDFTETVPVILRPGWITKESMEEFLGCEVLMNTSLKASDHGIPRAPWNEVQTLCTKGGDGACIRR